MLSDEEKEAIEELKNKKADYFMISNLTGKTLLNLIEKQSKEIEELREDRKKYPIAMNDKQYKKVIELAQKDIKEELDRQINARIVNEEFIENNFISKDKIKAKIEDKESQINDIKDNLDYDEVMIKEVRRLENQVEVLQSLLEKE